VRILLLFWLALTLNAETGYDAWLRYVPVRDAKLPTTVVMLDDSAALRSAREELERGVRGMLGKNLHAATMMPDADCIIVGTLPEVRRAVPDIELPQTLAEDSYILKAARMRGHFAVLVASSTERGVLYGTFALLRKVALGEDMQHMNETHTPLAPIRWTNEWDNLDGSIERGYAGRSIFFEGGNVVADLHRAGDYARLLASIGINGCTVNNVNANTRLITPAFLPQLARIADAFRPWGVRLSIAVDFSSPKLVGHLDTFDPLDPKVAEWWKQKADEIYRAIPDLAGFLLKADSEGRVGPSTYGRSHADAANVIARALKPHGGVLVYRGFVYDHHMDWRILKNDRARAAYDNFAKLDGQFDDNALVQIKYGPIDFQVREPVSPLIGALKATNQTLEFQVTQEYTGQQRHLCFLLPMWKEVLDFDLHAADRSTPVKEIVSGKTFHRPLGGFVAVTNVGTDRNWLGHDLAMANLFAFGRIAWDADLTAKQIIDEWTRLTFGNDPSVVNPIAKMQLESWSVYEKYTGPLGAGGLTDIIGVHYGPGIESSERNGWGQWHRADENGIGMDRTVATGTGFIGQYSPPVASLYESLETCPDNLLLFMHHVTYTHILHSGKTVIQHIYDSHYEGAAEAQTFPERWKTLRGKIDEERYRAVLGKLEYQAGHAIVWRDAVCNWFEKMSHMEDARGRVGHYPGRIEAESMALDGYAVTDVTPWETASGGKAITCPAAKCAALTRFSGQRGHYSVSVEYFDQNSGAANYELQAGGKILGRWTADMALPTNKLNGHSSTRYTVSGVALAPGDNIRISGWPQGGELAGLDYIEIEPAAK
jgi:alpha-glucuronidase